MSIVGIDEAKYPYLTDYTSPLKKMERPLVGRQQEMMKLMAAMERPELCNVILLANAGSGKALASDTLIPVADDRGYVAIKDLKAGDIVFDQNGMPVTVLGVYPQGMLDAYRVTFMDHTSVICNDEHIWGARKYHEHNENKVYHEVTLREIMNYGAHKEVSRGKGKDKRKQKVKCWYIPVSAPVQRETHDFKIHPYVMGVLIGDGCLTDRLLSISSKDEALIKQVAMLLGASGYHKSVYNYTWTFEDANGKWKTDKSGSTRKYIQTSDLASCGDYECVFGHTADEKRIPREYFLGSVAQRYALLQGLMDTDKRADCSYSTTSLGLVEDVIELANSLGIRATYTASNRGCDNHSTEYSVHFSLESDRKKNLFSLSRKRNIAISYESEYYDKRASREIYDDISIDSVEKLPDKMDMTCIYVDSPDHLFLAGKNHIVTHNTALVQGTMVKDFNRTYLEVDLPKMIANLKNENEMADKLKQLFDEVARYGKEFGKEIVLFIDEFHQIVQLSAAAVEVLKPLLADSGTRGIRVIAATTYIEFQDYVAPNQPLVERLQRINLAEPDKETVVQILKGMAQRYGVIDQFPNDSMFEAIYEYTNRYVPANAQPRKSILMMDNMIGWHRFSKRPIDMKLLADVIYDTEGINIAFRVDATTIKKRLDEVVLAQQFATSAIENRLQICCADLNNKNKPMSSFLFTGSTGVGKRLSDDTMIPVFSKNGVCWKRNGDLRVGDMVFNREGKPVRVIEVFHFTDCTMLEVELTDGRKILADPEHLWQYKSRFGDGAKTWKVADTQTLMEKNKSKYYNKGRSATNVKFVIPMNKAVQWPERAYKVDSYVMGVVIGNGCLSEPIFSVSSNDEECIRHCAELIGAARYSKSKSSYTWSFYDGTIAGNGREAYIHTSDLLSEVPDIIGKKSGEKFIPDIYKTGSVEQRWDLIRGLFDTDGTIEGSIGRYNISYSTTSERLAYDIQHVLYSLGISSSVNCHSRKDKNDEYDVHVKIGNADKHQFFWISRKKSIAIEAAKSDVGKKRVKKFGDAIGIRDIRETNIRCNATCIMVDDPEHLYQAGDFIVTHNTEMTKQLAKILFNDENKLIRMDMTEYALDESLDRFREELTTKVWATPYCIVLLDEIEKACPPVTRLLLQVLDDGRLIDRNNREVTFKNAYIVITTNAGSEIYKNIAQYNSDDAGSGAFVEKYEALIKDSISGTTGGGKFPPELLGRIDCLVPFQPLSESTMAKICLNKIMSIQKMIESKHNIYVRFDKKILRYVVQEKLITNSDNGGARIVISRFEKDVVTKIAAFLNKIDRTKVRKNTIYVYVEGEMSTDHKDTLEGDAKILVSYDDRMTNNKS